MPAMEDATPRHQSVITPDEANLLARIKAGDSDAFAACVRIHCRQMLMVAQRVIRNEQDANDAVQDAFLSAFKNINQFQGQSRLGTWLHRIVVNAALGRLRQRQRQPEKSIEDLLPHFGEDEHQIDPPVPWEATPETNVQEKETRELVQRSINQLPEIYRIVLLLRDIEGLDSEETAQMLGTTVAVVKTRLHRAHQALRSLLDPHFRRGNL